MSNRQLRTDVFRALILLVVYFGTAKFGLALGAVSGFATLVWPPTGIAFASLLIFGLRLWPAVMLGAFLANWTHGAPWYAAVGLGIGNTLEVVVGTCILQRIGFESSLRRVRDVVRFIVFAALLSPLLSATIGVLTMWRVGVVANLAFTKTWEAWYLGDMIGALVMTPFMLAWRAPLSFVRGRKRLAEALALTISTVIVCTCLFPVPPFPGPAFLTHTYFIFPILLWAAVRFHQRGAATMVLLISALSVWGTALGNGPFVSAELSASLVHLQSFMAVVATTTLVLAAAITERDHTEAALTEALSQRDEFLSVASHELRTPITSLHLRLQMVQSLANENPGQGALSDELRLSLRTFEKSTQRLITLLDELLDVTRIRVGKLRLNREPVDLSVAVHEVVSRFTEEAEQARTTITVHSSGPVRGNWDQSRIEQVLTNLVSNAIKYGECRPIEIRLNERRDRGIAILQVIDQGMGISAELRPRIFQRFERSDKAKRIPGLGLGLYISRQIISAHGGTIDAQSKDGKGTVFTVELPL